MPTKAKFKRHLHYASLVPVCGQVGVVAVDSEIRNVTCMKCRAIDRKLERQIKKDRRDHGRN